MRVAFGCDHAGFEEPQPYYKPEIVRHLEDRGVTVLDCGTDSPGAVDYPDIAGKVCTEIETDKADLGILLCGTGIGMSLAANKFPGIRAAVCTNAEMVRLTRAHNNANVICLGSRILDLDECLALIDQFLDTPFSDEERHVRRVGKIGRT